MDYLEKAKTLTICFGVYGHGHFDISDEEIAKLLEILDKKDVEKKLIKFYDKLEKQRMG